MEEMGIISAEWVLESIGQAEEKRPTAPVLKLLSPTLLVRESTGPYKRSLSL
jgi:hypothetical protein